MTAANRETHLFALSASIWVDERQNIRTQCDKKYGGVGNTVQKQVEINVFENCIGKPVQHNPTCLEKKYQQKRFCCQKQVIR